MEPRNANASWRGGSLLLQVRFYGPHNKPIQSYIYLSICPLIEFTEEVCLDLVIWVIVCVQEPTVYTNNTKKYNAHGTGSHNPVDMMVSRDGISIQYNTETTATPIQQHERTTTPTQQYETTTTLHHHETTAPWNHCNLNTSPWNHYNTETTPWNHYNTMKPLQSQYFTMKPLQHRNTVKPLQHRNNTETTTTPWNHCSPNTSPWNHYNTATPWNHYITATTTL